jgi:hypothetical protein
MENEMKGDIRIQLEIDDAYIAAEPIRIRAKPDREIEALTASIENTEYPESPVVKMLQPAAEFMATDEFSLAPGAYRVTVSGDQRVIPVTDVFMVQ